MEKAYSKSVLRIPSKQLETRDLNQSNSYSTRKSKCTIRRCICLQLLILLGLLTLAALIIPIVVLVYDNLNNACAVTYSDTFTYTAFPTTAQCSNWQTFTSTLTCRSYSKMHIYGSNDQTGVTLTDSFVVTALATALRYNGSITINSNGAIWSVGSCWGGYGIGSTGSCNCGNGYAVRPCVNSAYYWGGTAGTICNAQSQTLSISFS
ncbi:unnamed protein product [Adineta ricciae]|uniref:Uncharacterized protein n=1 Tax=Adineta ricciae TaxID=249248 RepID=A0A815IL75_ADIRI|nr:unnamed protein product [Adineta ricciae]CAF1529414.1 unnamed protein product [Adineta ricciae]